MSNPNRSSVAAAFNPLSSVGSLSPCPERASKVVVPCDANRVAHRLTFSARTFGATWRMPLSGGAGSDVFCNRRGLSAIGTPPPLGLSGAKTGCVWESTKPGNTTLPLTSMRCAPRAAARFSIRRVRPTSRIFSPSISTAPSEMIPSSRCWMPRRGARPRSVTSCRAPRNKIMLC